MTRTTARQPSVTRFRPWVAGPAHPRCIIHGNGDYPQTLHSRFPGTRWLLVQLPNPNIFPFFRVNQTILPTIGNEKKIEIPQRCNIFMIHILYIAPLNNFNFLKTTHTFLELYIFDNFAFFSRFSVPPPPPPTGRSISIRAVEPDFKKSNKN